MPGVRKKEGGKGVSEKGEGLGRKGIAFPTSPSPLPSAPYFSQSLPVSFLSRKFLETPATQATSADICASILKY